MVLRRRKCMMWTGFHYAKSGSDFFKDVSNLATVDHRAHSIIKNGLQVVCGNGERIKLWKDIVWDSIPLKLAFPRIFVLSSNKEGAVKDFGNLEGSKWVWDIKLRRPNFGWEREQWQVFVMSLDNINVRKDFHDTIVWVHCTNGIFSVSSFQRCLKTANVFDGVCSSFQWFLEQSNSFIQQRSTRASLQQQ
ncbi:hypothetical protein Ddye_013937 [Dipteronia dyeriana]|uniref:Uncharacterized protein n=1 Tax=Dipteronia dyeriana TaxID=168575 RepID=A0AAD9X7E6_9ROSI|nr:hypothetical protein Ddye_013937 [Dipteronia dyeriana]